MKRQKSFKCRNCKGLFKPDHRQGDKQKYCSKPECKKASKRESQKKWLSKPENKNYFKGAENVKRVQEWRKTHPCYWKKIQKKDALQDTLNAQVPDNTGQSQDFSNYFDSIRVPLQDTRESFVALLIGLIATLADTTLQDEIAKIAKSYKDRGQQILGCGT